MDLPDGYMAQRPRVLAPGEGRIVPALSTPNSPTLVMDAVDLDDAEDLPLMGGVRRPHATETAPVATR